MRHFELKARDRGLTFNTGICEVIPSAGQRTNVPEQMFPGWQWRRDGNFKLLGAPIGDVPFTEAHTDERRALAAELLKSVGKYDHCQGALQLLRHCASWSRLVYSARIVPLELHETALDAFVQNLRGALGQLTGDTRPERSWLLAQLGITHGGIGIRDPPRHVPAAYLASLSVTSVLCGRIDASFDPGDEHGGSRRESTMGRLQARVLDAAVLPTGTGALKQKMLSGMVDAAVLQQLLREAGDDPWFHAHVSLIALAGAGAWLTAPPAQDGREMDATLFRVALKRRLRCPMAEEDSFYPCCGQCSDRWGDHALVCACNGDRTVRHNAVRNICYV